MEADDLKRALHGHVRVAEQTFTALQRGEGLKACDPARGLAAMRMAIRRAAATFTPLALDELRRRLVTVAFWHPAAATLPEEFDAAALLLPEPGENWLGDFCAFLTALRRVLCAALAAVGSVPLPVAVPARQAGVAVPPPVLLNVRAAAGAMGISEKAVRHQIDAGKLPVVRRGRRVFVNARALERQVDAGTEYQA